SATETHSLQDLRQAAVTSKVFVQRDYTSGTICKFQTKFPAELESRIDKQQFEETIQTLNNLYAEAEKLGGRSYLEGCLACLTAYTIFLCSRCHQYHIMKRCWSGRDQGFPGNGCTQSSGLFKKTLLYQTLHARLNENDIQFSEDSRFPSEIQ
uniref:Golgin subfamily A member 7 n=1 Tax=Sinocyclocheilus rhinocerous TaxID=307959 RepID=A0A673KYN1_9TELE